jgi:hypothetical protein
MVKEGSRWSDSNSQKFRVIHIIELEEHTWIHYIKDNVHEDETREYSCYVESFLARFSPIVE